METKSIKSANSLARVYNRRNFSLRSWCEKITSKYGNTLVALAAVCAIVFFFASALSYNAVALTALAAVALFITPEMILLQYDVNNDND